MKVQTYTQLGKKSKTAEVSESVFGLNWNGDLVHQVVVSLQSNLRRGTAHTKDRSEVSGGGKKPWKQKGTGRARHGSNRSPIWVGGGVTHGPRSEKDYSKKINVKERAKALYVILSRKLKDEQVLFVDSLECKAPKTTEAKDILVSLSSVAGFEDIVSRSKNAALVVTFENDENVKRSFANFGNVMVRNVRDISALDVAVFKYIVIVNPEEVSGILEARGAKKVRAVEINVAEPAL